MSKPTINYWLDVLIGLAFVASAVSGIVFLLPFAADSVLGISYAQWDTIHTVGSLLLVSGVLVHLALHWKWLTHMTRKTMLPSQPGARSAAPIGAADADRRGFLRLAGYTALVAGVAITGYELLGGARTSSAASDGATTTASVEGDVAPLSLQTTSVVAEEAADVVTPVATEASTTTSILPVPTETPVSIRLTPTATPAASVAAPAPVTVSSIVTVACRKGQVYCPYPGRCHSYHDDNGNGYCDLSEPV